MKRGKFCLWRFEWGGLYYVCDNEEMLSQARRVRDDERDAGDDYAMSMLSVSEKNVSERQLIHERYGHISYALIGKHWPTKTDKQKVCFCEACAATKLRRKSFPLSNRVVT